MLGKERIGSITSKVVFCSTRIFVIFIKKIYMRLACNKKDYHLSDILMVCTRHKAVHRLAEFALENSVHCFYAVDFVWLWYMHGKGFFF